MNERHLWLLLVAATLVLAACGEAQVPPEVPECSVSYKISLWGTDIKLYEQDIPYSHGEPWRDPLADFWYVNYGPALTETDIAEIENNLRNTEEFVSINGKLTTFSGGSLALDYYSYNLRSRYAATYPVGTCPYGSFFDYAYVVGDYWHRTEDAGYWYYRPDDRDGTSAIYFRLTTDDIIAAEWDGENIRIASTDLLASYDQNHDDVIGIFNIVWEAEGSEEVIDMLNRLPFTFIYAPDQSAGIIVNP